MAAEPDRIPADVLAKLEDYIHGSSNDWAAINIDTLRDLIAAAKREAALAAELTEAVKLLEPLVAEDIGPYAKYHGSILSADQYRAAAAFVQRHRGEAAI